MFVSLSLAPPPYSRVRRPRGFRGLSFSFSGYSQRMSLLSGSGRFFPFGGSWRSSLPRSSWRPSLLGGFLVIFPSCGSPRLSRRPQRSSTRVARTECRGVLDGMRVEERLPSSCPFAHGAAFSWTPIIWVTASWAAPTPSSYLEKCILA